MRSYISFLIISILTVTLSGCADGKITMRSYDGSMSVTMSVEIADSPTERERGLMKRGTIDPQSGMLFVFKEPQVLQFWMKDTTIPLGIIFFDHEGNFVNALDMKPCSEDPCPVYRSAALAQYALEVTPEFRQEKGIGVGWKLDLATVKKNARAS